MELVHIALLDNDTLKTHQKREQAPYERIISSPKRLTRYYGNAPLICYGEKVWTELNNPHHTSVYLEQVGINSWYSCVMDSDGVLQEKMGSFPLLCDVLAYDLFMAHTIFTANDLPSDIEGREEQHTQYVPSILKEAFDGYRLKKAKKTMSPMHFIIVLLFLLISGGIALLVQMPSEPVTIVRPNSPLQQWQEHYSESLQVSDTLLNAQHLLVMSTLLPTGSSATTLSLRDKALILPIHNEPTVNPEEWRLWLNSNPSFTSVYDKTKQQVIVPIPPHHTLVPHYDRKRERILLQGLHELGIGIVLKEQRMPLKHGLITQYQLSGTLPLAALDIISELLHHPMVSLNEFSLSLNDDLTVTMTLGITLQGTIS